jgi:hypothetical protein
VDRKLPTVLRLLRHHIPAGRQAASGVLGAWADRAIALEEPALAAAEKELAGPDTDIETLSTLIGILGRQRSEASLPLLARVLRDPSSRNRDVDWCSIEAIADIVNGDTLASLSGALAFATSATAQSAVGTYTVSPSGLSSSNYVITFGAGVLTVVRGGVTVAVSTSPAPSGLNQPITFTASVGAAAPADGAPAGTIRLFDGATLLGSSTLSAGSASLTTAGLTAGVHSIEARYDGDASFDPGTGSASHTVNSAATTPVITLASNRNPSSVGQSVTLTAALGMNTGPVSGTVQLYDGASLLGTSAIVSGSAAFTTTALAAGSHAITVRYLGSGSAPPAISGVFVQAVGAAGWKNRTSSATLSASPNPSVLGAAVTLTADVTGSNGTPAGAVLFMVNGQVVGGPVTLTAISGSTAQATVVLPGLAGGRHIITATYLGSSNYKGSTAAVTHTVN